MNCIQCQTNERSATRLLCVECIRANDRERKRLVPSINGEPQCKNGCDKPRYMKRRICSDCVAAEMRDRRAKDHEGVHWGKGRPAMSLTPERVREAAAKNKNGMSLKKVSAVFKVSPKTMAKYMREQGFEVRTMDANKNCTVVTDREFYKQFNPIMGRMASVSLKVRV